MRIGLDARTVYWPTRHGTGKTLIQLYRQLAKLRPQWQVVAYHRQRGWIEPLLPEYFVSPRMIEMVGDRLDAWQRWRLPMAAWQDQVDVLHCPANFCPTWWLSKTLVTIHDLIPLDRPEGRSASTVRRFVRSVRAACKRAAWVMCPSRYTFNRLVREFDADPSRMSIVPWAPDRSVQPVSPHQYPAVLKRFGIDKPFVLHLGSDLPRKNTRRVLNAWGMLDRSMLQQHQLVVVGLDDASRRELQQTVADSSSQDSVGLHGYASETDLAALLSTATVLAYPSLSEGFGLPILDAQAAGTAVLTSDCTSMPEVAGDAAWLVDPTDECSIASGISQLLDDVALRNDLDRRARQRLRGFSWQDTAEQFALVLQQAANLTSVLNVAC